jgi:hypothetical protein
MSAVAEGDGGAMRQNGARTKGTYLQAQYQRLKSRRGGKKAAVAVAASILTTVYYILRDDLDYRTWGRTTSLAATRARSPSGWPAGSKTWGYEVVLHPLAA